MDLGGGCDHPVEVEQHGTEADPIDERAIFLHHRQCKGQPRSAIALRAL